MYSANNYDVDAFERQCSERAKKVIYNRYLLRNPNNPDEIIETIPEMFERVASALAAVDGKYGASSRDIARIKDRFIEMMVNRRATPAGRTLANAGSPTAKYAANCVVLHIEDSMDDIFQTLHDASLLQQAGYGVGFPLHLMRPAGAPAKTSSSRASGPLSFLRVYNTAFSTVKQQNRHGANMAVMRVDHPDILEFINFKKIEGDISCFNISVGLTDEFMRQAFAPEYENVPWRCTFNGDEYLPRIIERDDNHVFISAKEVNMSAVELFDEIVSAAWSNGEPGVVFLDTVNKTNPLPGLGRIESCNPCVTSDTWIMTSNGPRQVKDLLDSPYTAIVDGEKYEATAFFYTGTKPVYDVRTSVGYSVKATSNHKIAVNDARKWVEVGDLKPGDEIVLNHHDPSAAKWDGRGSTEEGYIIGKTYAYECVDSDEIHEASSDFQLGFLSGLFDENGVVCDTTVRLNQCDSNLLDIAQKMLIRFGIVSTINGGYELVISRSSIVLFRDYINFKNDVEECKRLDAMIADNKFCESCYYSRVTDIVKIEEDQPTYDCTVDAVHAFDANGIMVHNCGEQFLHDGDVCNLGSVNLGEHVSQDSRGVKYVDYGKIGESTATLTHMLDNVIDLLDFPVERVRRSVLGNRRIGVGVMGFADMLYKLGIRYGSKESLDLAEQVMLTIQRASEIQSEKMGIQRGVFPNWEKSEFARINLTEGTNIIRRNSALTSVAPTGTISAFFDASGGIEPEFMLGFTQKNVLGGTNLHNINRHFIAACSSVGIEGTDHPVIRYALDNGSLMNAPNSLNVPEGIKHVFVVAGDLTAENHTRMQAAFQKWCDNAISKTINFPNDATKEDVCKGYKLAWRLGCKGCTVYRDGSRNVQVMNNLDTSGDGEEVESQDSFDDVESFRSDIMSMVKSIDNANSVDDFMNELIRRSELHFGSKTHHTSMAASSSSSSEDLATSEEVREDACPGCESVGTIKRSQSCSECVSCAWSACDTPSRSPSPPHKSVIRVRGMLRASSDGIYQ
jgi:ribonucleoside-diphosphate reductase alpha chain